MQRIPALRRFDIYVLKKNAQGLLVPANGATVGFYKQGATVSANTTIPIEGTNYPVPVYNVGGVVAGDSLRKDLAGIIFTVESTAVGIIYLTSPSPSPVTLNAGDRLFVTTNRPKICKDPVGSVEDAIAITADTDGRARGYMREYRFDYAISGISGEPTRLFIDAEGSYVMR